MAIFRLSPCRALDAIQHLTVCAATDRADDGIAFWPCRFFNCRPASTDFYQGVAAFDGFEGAQGLQIPRLANVGADETAKHIGLQTVTNPSSAVDGLPRYLQQAHVRYYPMRGS
jgi:hypothetical protein